MCLNSHSVGLGAAAAVWSFQSYDTVFISEADEIKLNVQMTQTLIETVLQVSLYSN